MLTTKMLFARICLAVFASRRHCHIFGACAMKVGSVAGGVLFFGNVREYIHFKNGEMVEVVLTYWPVENDDSGW